MRTDNELLELAAKAAGIEVWPGTGFQAHMLFTRPAKADPDGKVTGVEWNPLADDGDALRLAVKLRITVEPDLLETKASAYVLIGGKRQHFVSVSGKVTRHEATRRAIVLAAAKMVAQAHPKQHYDGGQNA